MKRFLTALIVLVVTALAMPCVVFAADEPLEDIPARSNSESGKAYCLYEKNNGGYTLTYVNSAGTGLLYSSEEKFKYNESFSEDGKTLFYAVNNTVYKYSYESGKRQKIYTAGDPYIILYSSPNGEYCLISTNHYSGNNIDLIIWHDGKTVSQTERNTFDIWGGDEFFGINDKGEVFYTLGRDIYILDMSGKRLAQKIPMPLPDNEDEYDDFETGIYVYPQSGTYMAGSGKDLYFGELEGEQHKMSFSENAWNYVIAQNGEGLILYNGEYVARYDIRSGKHKSILKISPEQYSKRNVYFMRASEDLNNIAFVNYSKNKLVRLSGWDGEKNGYTKKQEIKLNGTGRENIIEYTSDMNTLLISYRDEKNYPAYWTADFESESFVKTGYWDKVDRFGHMIEHNGGKIKIITPGGGETEVFDGVGITCEPYLSNGFYVFYSGGPDDYYEYEGNYPLTYYYIDKNGKAVKWYEETHYMEIMF
ncbi:MAG: hypothetical protein K2N72_14225 [Oscillospiraceae bacterium]|nr:hypothetical protein [Oscillospiraceae bacterium]